MQEYKVVWSMDIEAKNPQEAALQAHEYITEPASSAKVFQVIDKNGIESQVDLWETEEE